jgi:hypothetical protein
MRLKANNFIVMDVIYKAFTALYIGTKPGVP